MSDVPHSLDRFEILRVLGKGGMGTVYLARDQRLGRQVALKVLNAAELGSAEARGRFLREARSAAAIRHPNVATIYEVGETAAGEPFLVLEYCEGETLAQRMRRRPLSAGEFLSVSTQIAAGLAAAHATGLVHRDIKSANVIIEPNGVVKILDFGLAKLLHGRIGPAAEAPSYASTSSGQFFGTLHYLAPEQTRGVGADERSDLFSVGVVMYQMACGRLPFEAGAPLLVLEQIRFAEPEPFQPLDPGFPPEAARIISRLLQKEPGARYQNASELLRDLESIDQPTVHASTHSTRSSLGRTRPRRHQARVAVAAIALAVVASAAYYVQQQSSGLPGQTAAANPATIRSMAVLPLNNLANNASDEFLSVSLADALVTKLQQIPSLQVRPTSAVLHFQKKNVDARTASEELQVEGILEGNYLAAGDLVRVNLQLTDSRTGYGVWAATIDGKRDDLLKLIDEVSARTLSGLNERLGVRQRVTGASEPRSEQAAAYEQYLRARALSGSFVPEQFEEQLAALRRAVEIDPEFAAAHADLAIALSLGHTRGLTTDPQTLQKAEWYARQAVRLDPNLAQAHLALGRVFVRHPDRYRESAREILAALRLNASDTHALHSVVTYFVSSGDLQKAECVGRRIVHLDPQSNEARTRGYWYVNSVDPERAIANARWALESPESEVAGHDIRAVALILQGNLAEAEREAGAVSRLVPGHYLGKSLRAMIAAARGERRLAEELVDSFEADASRNHWAAIRVALVYGQLGDTERALQWVRRATDLGHHSWYALVKHPWLEPLQTDPRFQEIVGKIKGDLDDVRDDMVGLYSLMCGT
ncbi:MAG TPA: protein kinase [Thermoanaerobaculia bacterium]|nr:protein kinase [Thermoanaerobaculia bacterium]